MKLRVLTLLGVLALGAGTVIQAQDYDDIYYDGGKTTTEVKRETKKVETTRTRTEVPTQYKVTVQKNYQTDRDVDEYNRRGGIYAQPENDTLYLDAPEHEGTFGNTQRIERFYNPDIVVLSNDDELVELYYDSAPRVNLIIGTNYGYAPRFGWGFGNYWPYYAYDPFCDPFYDPWYYSGWYGWHRPYYSWYGWHSPWYYNYWGWGYSRWGWYDSWAWRGWHTPWGHYGPHMWSNGTIYHNTGYWHRDNRLPGDHRSLLSGSGGRRGGLTTGGTRSGVRTAGNTGRGGTVTNGRTRPSSMTGGSNMGRTRHSTAVGNIDRTLMGGGGSAGYSGGSVRNRGTSSSGYSGSSSSSSRSYSPSSTSRSSSYGSSRSSGYSGSSSRSSGYSGSSSRSSGYSSGSFGGGSRGGGGFSGGGSSRSSGGGGGGGRRH